MSIAEAATRLRRIYDVDPAAAPKRDSDLEPLWGPVVVCGAISSDDFLCLLESEDDAELYHWEFEPFTMGFGLGLGRVVMHSVSTPVHQRVASAIVASIQEQVADLADDLLVEVDEMLVPPVSLVCRLHGSGHLQAADDALVPADAAKSSLPTLVVDVAYLNESLAALQCKMTRWMTETTQVQVAIGVKVFSKTRRTLLLMQRGGDEGDGASHSTQYIEFGSGNGGYGSGGTRGRLLSLRSSWTPAPAIAAFPLGALFEGFTLPLALDGQHKSLIVVDPDHLRGVVQRALRTIKRHGV